MNNKRNKDLKTRYHYFRSLGYSSKEANKYKHHTSINIQGIKLNYRVKNGKKTNKIYVVNNKVYKQKRNEIITTKKTTKHTEKINTVNTFVKSKKKIRNNSVFSNWGNLTHNEPHNKDMLRMATFIAKRDKQSLDYGYYYLYVMFTMNKTDSEMREIVKLDKSFEMYVRNKKGNKRYD